MEASSSWARGPSTAGASPAPPPPPPGYDAGIAVPAFAVGSYGSVPVQMMKSAGGFQLIGANAGTLDITAVTADTVSGEGIWQALRSGRVAGEVAAHTRRGLGGGSAWLERRYRLRAGLALEGHAAARRTIQQAMDLVVRHELHRASLVRALLATGYR